MNVAGIFAVAALETFFLQHLGHDLDHFRVAAEEDIGVAGVELHAGVLVQRALFEDGLDAADAPEEMLADGRVMLGM